MTPRSSSTLATARIALACACAAMGAAACAPEGQPQRQGEVCVHVGRIVTVSADEVGARLAGGLPSALRAVDKFRDAHLVPAGDPAFPEPQQLSLAAARDPALAAYACLGESQRRRDLYMFDLSDAYWDSEFSWRGRPASFKSDFIIHVADSGMGRTRLEVLEYRPRVRLGQHFVLRGHHGPGFYDDVRFVAPTTRDRKELLNLLSALVGS